MELDFVADLGADETGLTDSDAAFDAINSIEDPLRVTVPGGVYTFSERQIFDRREDVGFVGAVDDSVRFVSPDGLDQEWLRFECDCLLSDISLDRLASETSPSITLASPTKALLDRVTVEGSDDGSQHTPLFDIRMENPRSNAVFRELRIPARSGNIESNPTGRAGIGANSLNRATVTLEGCLIEECSGPGVDLGRSEGELRIDGGIFKNNAGAQIRFSQPASTVRDASVVVDPATAQSATESDYEALNGVVVGDQPTTVDESGQIVNCDIAVHSGSETLIDAGVYGTVEARETAITNTDITVDVDDVPAVHFTSPSNETVDPAIDYSLTVENLVCKGAAGSGDAIVVEGRPDTELRQTCIETPGIRQPYQFAPKAAVTANVNEVTATASCDFFRGFVDDEN